MFDYSRTVGNSTVALFTIDKLMQNTVR